MHGETADTPKVTIGRDWVRLQSPSLYTEGRDYLRDLFLRILALDGVVSVESVPVHNEVLIRFSIKPEQRAVFFEQIMLALKGDLTPLDQGLLPHWPLRRTVTWYCYGPMVSSWAVVRKSAGKIQIAFAQLANIPGLVGRLSRHLRQLNGVAGIRISASSGTVWISYDEARIDVAELLREVDALVWGGDVAALPVPEPEPVAFTTVNTSLGLAAAGELMLPIATTASAGIMLITNVATMREAVSSLRQGKLSTPVWMTALLACSIVTGQVLAYALTDWSWRYWERRTRRDLQAQQQAILQDSIVIPAEVNYTSEEGVEMTTPVSALRLGEHLSLGRGQYLPVDGIVLEGVALVDEQVMTGEMHPVRKLKGDTVYASSRIIFGHIVISVQAIAENTRAAAAVDRINATALQVLQAPEVNQEAAQMVNKTVPPTLAAAAVGLATGNLFTVGAILHQDWFSAVNMAVPLTQVQDMGRLMRQGVLLHDADTLTRLKRSRFLVIQDQPALRQTTVKLAGLDTQLAERDKLLSWVAGASLYLGDQRTDALMRACVSQQLAVKQPELLALEPDAITVRWGEQRLRLRNSGRARNGLRSLSIEVDSRQVGSVNFSSDPRPHAAEAIQRIRDLGVQVFLVSEQNETETAGLSQLLGADMFSGDMSAEQVVKFLQGLSRREMYPAYLGEGPLSQSLIESCHVSFSMGAEPGFSSASAATLMGGQLDALPTVFMLAHSQTERLRKTTRTALLPNLLCVVGGFGGVLNGITSGVLGNIGVVNVRRQASKDLDLMLAPSRRLLR